MRIIIREYTYVLMLEKWFFCKAKDLKVLGHMIDFEIPMEIHNYKLAVALNSCGWIYDANDRDENSTSIIAMKKTILELLELEIE